MNLLMVSPFFPTPSTGACTRVYHLLRALAGKYNVSLVVLGADTDEAEDGVLEEMKLKRFLKVPWSTFPPKRVQQALGMLRGRSSLLDSYHVKTVEQAINDLFQKDHYEVVLFESALM